MIHTIQSSLLQLSRRRNLAELTLREMAHEIGMADASPQQIKHHLQQLEKKGFLTSSPTSGQLTPFTPGWAKGLLGANSGSKLLSVPIIGTANCGPATIFAEQNFEGFLKISSRLLKTKRTKDLFAVQTVGFSMNRAELNGKKIDDGDYVIVDSTKRTPTDNDIILAIIDDKATLKRFIDDKVNGQIVLRADSSFDYEPIFLHPDDQFEIQGKAIAVVKQP